MKIVRTITEDNNLDSFLTSLLFSKKDIFALKTEKRVCVNDIVSTTDKSLFPNDVVSIDISKPETSNVKPIDFDLEIVYEDEIVLIINKPYGYIVHDDGNDSITVDNFVAGYYKKTGQKHGVYHIHRLDKETTGCLFYCKEKYLVPFFDQSIINKDLTRTYLALCSGVIEKKITINKRIGRDRHQSNKYRVSSTGKDAITHVKPIKQYPDKTLVECYLQTGRTHQIRVHLSSISHPIIGDELYDGIKAERLMLHSYSITFLDPIEKKKITVSSNPDFL